MNQQASELYIPYNPTPLQSVHVMGMCLSFPSVGESLVPDLVVCLLSPYCANDCPDFRTAGIEWNLTCRYVSECVTTYVYCRCDPLQIFVRITIFMKHACRGVTLRYSKNCISGCGFFSASESVFWKCAWSLYICYWVFAWIFIKTCMIQSSAVHHLILCKCKYEGLAEFTGLWLVNSMIPSSDAT